MTRLREKPYLPTLTFTPKNPEKQGVFGRVKKHEKIFKKPLALKSAF